LLPLMEDVGKQSTFNTFHGLDLSSVAIELLKKDHRFVTYNQFCENSGSSLSRGGAFGYVCDISQSLPYECAGVADVTSLLFCLSAVDPDHMEKAAKNVALSLKPGGVLVFRDYGLYDEAQLKLATSIRKQLKDGFYQKHDGTKCYYFTLEVVKHLFENAGLQVLDLKYLRRAYTNKSTGERRRRVWVQGRFKKP
jgi:SAM-dependent methyltransferase